MGELGEQSARYHTALADDILLSGAKAIILVGAGGYSYEEAADIANCAVGTMKSRVSRARKALEFILEEGRFTSASDGHANMTATALENIIGAVEKIAP